MNSYNKYKNDGWGLSKLAFEKLSHIMQEIIQESNSLNILEFGSGISTEFLIDNIILNNWSNIASITSFDNDEEYMYKIKNDSINEILKIYNTELLQCTDDKYEKMFQSKKYISEYMKVKSTPVHTRQKNCFYKIHSDDLQKNYNLVILDGPHGNGRNISFLRFKDNINFPCYILIDDITHYDFEERFLTIFKADIIFKNKMSKINTLDKFLSKLSINKKNKISPWYRGGDFSIYKINSLI